MASPRVSPNGFFSLNLHFQRGLWKQNNHFSFSCREPCTQSLNGFYITLSLSLACFRSISNNCWIFEMLKGNCLRGCSGWCFSCGKCPLEFVRIKEICKIYRLVQFAWTLQLIEFKNFIWHKMWLQLICYNSFILWNCGNYCEIRNVHFIFKTFRVSAGQTRWERETGIKGVYKKCLNYSKCAYVNHKNFTN